MSPLLNDTWDDKITPNDYYTTIGKATEAAGDIHNNVETYHKQILFMFEFYRANKVGGINSPYICMD